MGRDFIIVKIDTDRMTHGTEVAGRLRGERRGGIPWMVILDAAGKELMTSDGPKGNVGCPMLPHERAFFIEMLEKTSKRMGKDGIALVKKALDAYAEKVLGSRR